jgi:hypothetical protein
MSAEPGERGGEVAFVDVAEAGKMTGAVDQHLIPDAARILVYVEWTSELLADRAARQLGPSAASVRRLVVRA